VIHFCGMARYFFHIRNGDDFDEDTQGVDLPDVGAVENEAFTAARGLIADMVTDGEHINGMRFEVTDENGNIVLILPFKVLLD
jgi:hypothetical protein